MVMDVKEKVFGLVSARADIPGATAPEKMSYDFMGAGLIDSIGIVELIAQFEEAFNIRFSHEDLEGGRLGTMAGIVETVERLRTEDARRVMEVRP